MKIKILYLFRFQRPSLVNTIPNVKCGGGGGVTLRGCFSSSESGFLVKIEGCGKIQGEIFVFILILLVFMDLLRHDEL